MREQTFTINGRLIGLNEYILVERGNKFAAADKKRAETQRCAWEARQAKLKPMQNKANLYITYYEKNMKRDPDNIHFAVKFILDGLVSCGVLKGDSQRYIGAIKHNPIRIDQLNPRIVVDIVDSV